MIAVIFDESDTNGPIRLYKGPSTNINGKYRPGLPVKGLDLTAGLITAVSGATPANIAMYMILLNTVTASASHI